MSSGLVLKDALKAVSRSLKQRGFSVRGATFYRTMEEGNTILLSLQKSSKSTTAEAQVTLNYGVYSELIGRGLQDDPKSRHDPLKVHWRKRLTESGREKWLKVRSTDSADECARAIEEAAESLLPELFAHASDSALRDEWLSGVSPGITNKQRLLFAAMVVNRLGPPEKLGEVVEELHRLVSDPVHTQLLDRQLARAGIRVG